jgi:hypothetical protein
MNNVRWKGGSLLAAGKYPGEFLIETIVSPNDVKRMGLSESVVMPISTAQICFI